MSTSKSGGDSARNDNGPRSQERAPLVRRPLVTLGSAAVLAVYAAGYARTREAAARFADADRAARRPVPPASAPAPTSGDSAPAFAVVTTVAHDTSRVTPVITPSSAPETPAANKTVASGPNPRDLLAVGGLDTTAQDPGDTTTVVPAAPATTTDSVAKDSVVAAPAWKDGEYYGWGTSRHGDIQAGVEIRGGKITAAWVQQCLTRYSCSWIAALPGQVVSRQSPETDYVSGATQSTNAFYYAVVEALSKAK